MLEYACTDVVFHFNKAHLTDPTIPMWVLKFKGDTMYVNHVDCQIGWSTKETPDSAHTKGAIKIKHCLLTIDDENCATITQLTEHDKIRLKNKEKGITRILITGSKINNFRDVLKTHSIKHAPLKAVYGGCGTSYYITDILAKSHLSMLTLAVDDSVFRILKENETYYKMYDDPTYQDKDYLDEDELWDLYSDDDSEEDDD